MTSELVVDVQPKEVSIALLEDKSLVELQSEGRNISFSVGNMYLGRIKKLMPGLNACFVDVGYEKDAFLHYLDLGPQFNSLEKFVKQTLSDKKKLTSISKATLLPDLDKDGTVSNTLKVGQEVVVQIVKEPISNVLATVPSLSRSGSRVAFEMGLSFFLSLKVCFTYFSSELN